MDKPVALITGAGSGIGAAAAMALAKAGHSIMLTGRTAKKLRDVKEGIAYKVGFGPQLETAPADLADAQACASVVEKTRSTLGRLDVLVHCAGHAELAPLADSDADLWDRALGINLKAAAQLARAAWTHLAQRGGLIVNISSMAAVDPFPGLGAYAAAKAGLNMLTKVLAQEGAESGIRAVAIMPGAVETPMLRGLFDASQIPADRTLSPEAVAGLIAECVSGARAFDSGQAIAIEP